jgi:hypothetical protein
VLTVTATPVVPTTELEDRLEVKASVLEPRPRVNADGTVAETTIWSFEIISIVFGVAESLPAVKLTVDCPGDVGLAVIALVST